MKPTLLYAVLVVLLLVRCAAPAPMTELPKATSIDDYCTGAAKFALNIARKRDQGDDLIYTKQAVLADSVSLTEPSQARERKKILEVLAYVYKNTSRTPQEIRTDMYQTCVKERTEKPETWFLNKL
ncbi:MAG: hypothetical protein ACYC6X_00925 [Minisyncoccota bacterium]